MRYRILIDTNIFIYRESNRKISDDIALFDRVSKENGLILLVHPDSKKEIEQYSIEERRVIALSKIAAYPVLSQPPDFHNDANFRKKVGETLNKNSEIVDNQLLYSVYKNAVNILVTEDKGILTKAKNLGIKDKVLTVKEFDDKFEQMFFTPEVRRPTSLKQIKLHNIDKSDPFFDSLRAEYKGFDNWFDSKSQEGRSAFVYYKDEKLAAIEIYKEEDEEVPSVPSLPKKKRLKISTLKVEDTGNKIGELLLKLIFDYCKQKNITETYLTHFTKSGTDYLVDLIKEYGFDNKVEAEEGQIIRYKITDGKHEDVFLKCLKPENNRLGGMYIREFNKKYYPSFYDGIRVNKFIIPIQPKFHDRLFVEFRGRQSLLKEHGNEFIVAGNTIKKAYLTQSNIKKISEGDVVIFYRSKDLKKTTAIGTIESVHYSLTDYNKIQTIIGKRTVYSKNEIEKMLGEGPITVIMFIWNAFLGEHLTLSRLRATGVLKGQPQGPLQIDEEKYLKLKRLSNNYDRYTIDKT